MGRIYKVYCEFFVRANNADFVEKHIIVKEVTPTEFTNDPQETIYEDLTKK